MTLEVCPLRFHLNAPIRFINNRYRTDILDISWVYQLTTYKCAVKYIVSLRHYKNSTHNSRTAVVGTSCVFLHKPLFADLVQDSENNISYSIRYSVINVVSELEVAIFAFPTLK